MNTDIRLLVSFRGHRKRIKLENIAGPRAVLCLIDLWLSAAENSPEGTLIGWDEEDIAAAAGWSEDPKKFVEYLIKCGFLEKKDGAYVLHDWNEHQSWAIGARKRSESARLNAMKRWEKYHGIKCAGNAAAMPPQKEGNAPFLSSPFLSSPLLKKNITTDIQAKIVTEKKEAKKTKHRCKIPDDFDLNEKRMQAAQKHGLTADRIPTDFEHFKAHHQSKGTLMLDWDKAWITWILNIKRWDRNSSNRSKLQPIEIKNPERHRPWSREQQAKEERKAYELTEALRKRLKAEAASKQQQQTS